MELNIINLIYLFFRFAPFIIVSYFTLESIFNQDLKGVIYIIGLLVATVCTILFGNIIGQSESPIIANPKCTTLTIGNNEPISKLPLSQTVFGYTLSYLSYFIGVNNLATQNIPTFIIFPLIILADMMWNTSNGCSSNPKLLVALIIGGLIGVLWAMIIDSTGMVSLTYFSGVSNKAVCSQPSRSMYRCRSVRSSNK
jgi:hypothetical protein